MWGAPAGQYPPSIPQPRELHPPSTSQPLSLLPPTRVQPDPCPGAGGPRLAYSLFPSLSPCPTTSGGAHGCWQRGNGGRAVISALPCQPGGSSLGPRRGGTADGPLCPAAWPLPSRVHCDWPCVHIPHHSPARIQPRCSAGGALPHGWRWEMGDVVELGAGWCCVPPPLTPRAVLLVARGLSDFRVTGSREKLWLFGLDPFSY